MIKTKNVNSIKLINSKAGKMGVPMLTSNKGGGILYTLGAIAAVSFVGALAYGVTINEIAPRLSSSVGIAFTPEQSVIGLPGQGAQTLIIDDNAGDGATITFNAYDLEQSTETSQAVPISVYNQNGVKLQDVDSYMSSTSLTNAVVGDTLSLAGGNSSYYVDPANDLGIDSIQKTFKIGAHKIQTEANMLITGYDDTASTALSAADNSSQEDYQISLGASQEKSIYFKVTNNAADAMFRVGGVCTGTEGNVSAFKPADNLWEEAIVPDGLSDAISWFNNGNEQTTGELDKCWRLKVPIDLHEFDDVKYKFTIKAKTTDPTQNEGSEAYLLFLDGAHAESSDGTMIFDFYKHDETEGSVGLAETSASPAGLQLGSLIEVE